MIINKLKNIFMRTIVSGWLVIAALCLLPATLMAQTTTDGRRRVELRKEAFFDIRIMESSQASHIAAEVADFMKTHEDVAITVIGYADRETGNPTLNEYYAKGRAENFRRDLVQRFGVDPNRIAVDWKGDRIQPFAENVRNRCVIVEGYGYEPIPATAEARPVIQSRTDTLYVIHSDTVYMVSEPKPERTLHTSKEHLWHNWFVILTGGPSIFQGDHNIDAEWGDRIYPAFDLSIGKWLYPLIGLRAGVTLDVLHNYYNANADYPNPLASKYGEFVHGASPDEPYSKAPWLYRMDYKAWDFYADVMINFSSFMWKPYNRRFWNLIGYAGVGCIATWDHGSPEWHNQDWFNYATSWHVGLMNTFRVSEHFDINIDLRVKKFNDDFNCFRQGRDMDGITNLMIGGTWHFTKRGF